MEEENVLAMSSTLVETRAIFCIHSWPVLADPCFPNLRPFLREDLIVSSVDTATLGDLVENRSGECYMYYKQVLLSEHSWAKLETTIDVFTCSKQ